MKFDKEPKIINSNNEKEDRLKYDATVSTLKMWFESSEQFEKIIMKSVQLVTVDFTKKTITCSMVVEQELSNIMSSLHGGVIATLVDIISSMAIMMFSGKGTPSVSVDLVINYANAATVGQTLYIESCAYKIGRNLAFTDTIIKGDKGIIAKGSHNKFILEPKI
ncbi:thioesterase superfamily protein [Cavenderia fasciculata]|uniref:Acyl-coenzyme A thioesterase 13 n=1 Tax=Cavenderia fasciculata TaxID=261658 RepID=F4PSX9_CACFS|nr:thioesterase superfamily protein [Cavenderia fasciculata]EGG20768.1 thioesterase superfamily protein [Cavenderia fasciculata]|eukprot:XP_004358618.1 thioesterase superfamily protein [Cavenderia fasciculata]